MKTSILLLVFSFYLSFTINAQDIKVLTLGTFHFDFPNLDIKKIESGDQIDVLQPKYQDEIADVVTRLSRFKPNIIAIEVSPEYQSRTDSLYLEYLDGNYSLGRNEYVFNTQGILEELRQCNSEEHLGYLWLRPYEYS